MSLNAVMARLAEGKPKPAPEPPVRDLRTRLAVALMLVDSQVSCRNCRLRYRPCRVYRECKEDGAFSFFEPKDSILAMQRRRVDAVIDTINNTPTQ